MKATRGHRPCVSFQTWWLENKLRAVDGKLRRLRFAQKRVRDSEAELQRAKRAGLAAAEFEVRESTLQQKREKLAHEIASLVGEEQRIKGALRQRGVSLSSH